MADRSRNIKKLRKFCDKNLTCTKCAVEGLGLPHCDFDDWDNCDIENAISKIDEKEDRD